MPWPNAYNSETFVDWIALDASGTPSLGPGSPVREVYPSIRDAMLNGEYIPMSDGVYAVAVDGTCEYDPTHTFLDDLPSGCMIGDPAEIDVGSVFIGRTDPVTQAFIIATSDQVFETLPTVGRIAVAVVLFHWTGDPATSHLISYNGLQRSSESISLPTDGGIRWHFNELIPWDDSELEWPVLFTF